MQSTSIVMRKRISILFFLAALALLFLVCRLAYIQFFLGDQLRQDALDNRTRDIPVEAKRGSIFDRKGNELVTSVSVDSVFAIPSQVTKPDEVAAKVAVVLDMDVDKVHKQITQKQSFVWIKRKVDYKQAQELKSLKLDGIGFVEESKRYYLKDGLAAHVLGFVGVDNQGLTGIENTFETDLRGIPGRIVVERDAAGREISNAVHNYFPPVQGHNMVLTIDETVQYFVERELDKLIDKYQPKGAVITVMDPRTGEILAMGNRPTFDPNRWSVAPQSTWDRNPAIWYNYEPGSTFKIITLSAALEEKTVNKNDRFYDPGYVKVADRNIRCWKAGGHGSQSFEEVIQNSCNPGFIKIGLDIGISDFYKYVRGFGFGTQTGVILPGEAQGIMIPEKKATTLNLATMSIGQSIAVTPLQLLTAVSASVNGGLLMEPMLVKAVTDHEGTVVREYAPKSVRRVISEETSREVGVLLEGVVLKGSGRNAYADGYRVGGKTGTAQVVGSSGGYVSGRYVSSFVGFAPVEDPQVAILVMLIEPQGGVYYGSQVAAPAFRAVMQDTLRYLGVPEQKNLPKPKSLNFWENTREPEEVRVPQVVNLPLNEAVQELRGSGLNFMIRGQGPVVYGQVPEAGASVLEGTTVIIELKTGPEADSGGQVTIPDLTGLTIKQVGGLLENMGLRLEPVGTGIASQQKPLPGEKVDRGALVRVDFEPAAERPGITD
ncbi:MAG: stage V sporulation protein D [Clostridia bacterium]|nr:stage V sporulation protein D [Clostridia bacterium]MDQ7791465.1 stage V sporulation protein D [Clostridia bacterium]